MSKIAINEVFGPSIQGEGRYAGTPSVFVRLNSCNLRCAFKGSLCDTPYTSHHPEKSKLYEVSDLAKEIVDLVDIIGGRYENSHIVITGGEPLLQQKALKDLIDEIRIEHDCYNQITIETNGTIMPDTNLDYGDIFWSISPKLSTSCCFEGTDVPEALREQHKKTRINLEALAAIVMSGCDYQLKFVYSGPESVDEINDLIYCLKDHIKSGMGQYVRDIANSRLDEIDEHIMLMPEGTTIEQLNESSIGAVDACIENGWKFCDRLHIRIWGNQRAV